MTLIKIRKGLKLPVKGAPEGDIVNIDNITESAILGDDFPSMKPSMLVKEGDHVRKGQPVFVDRKNQEITYTAPVTGTVKSVRRGAKRKFLSMVFEKSSGDAVRFNTRVTDRQSVYELLKESGLLASFRERPFAKCPSAQRKPQAVFINCMDTRPLAPDMSILLKGFEDYFRKGAEALTKLSDKTFICKGVDLNLPDVRDADVRIFDGPHPAGLSGTHVHFLYPASMNRTVWTVDMQSVIDIGYLLTHGELNETTRVALCGGFEKPCYVETLKGAPVAELVKGRVQNSGVRLILGSILYGLTVEEGVEHLSSCFPQVTAIPELQDRYLFGWTTPRPDLFSVKNIFSSAFTGKRKLHFDTALNGAHRPMVPVGTYEKVMPLDILPTHLLRALIVGDLETAEKLGCLELSEEDLSLCTYVCPGKIDYAPIIRDVLTTIEKEG
ncbi:NADH:ubiquinone oxidoreductase, subunit A [Denitrovibrio acetiphilus DSM 12809]|uniref:Na(+)-translocating NADH-quinone reductase subunit A n=1 Tax=Denitrovibrio acetiphilus (strain DSM 12809 / NBRC 114555 / N2460) TaxID=522772 RepID=D4H1M5_DENA2|nr:NADH:ubiquinone reductase (Na(+)-transporting) subunit A [Denitrovibrio acetiphilus]ADD68785.1 NADH:ubiquinone oxidoreductase, subunit A [Denitrovibrio acetiphilus DSM 12809]